MKKRPFYRSITVRLTFWFFLVLAVIVIMTFQIFRFVSGSVLRKTIRGYLLSSVEENSDKIKYLTNEEFMEQSDNSDFYIHYKDGWLEVDDDFLDEINDVQSALYMTDGTMLYGKNPIARKMEEEAFSISRVYRYETEPGSRYFIYDRKLTAPDLQGLWIRGVVPLSSEERQLRDIFNSAMIYVPVLVFVGMAGGYLTIRQALRPIRRIQKVTSEIALDRDLGRRIEIGDVDRELYDLAVSFNDMLDRLEHSFQAEQQFTSDASHELRTPTSVILAQTELALERERSGEEYRRALGVIARQGRRMNTLISSMLDYTRLELRPENYPLEETDLSDLVRAAAEDMAMIGLKNIKLETGIRDGIQIRGNRILLERMVQNLIDNAYKYGRENGNILVTLTLELPEDKQTEASREGRKAEESRTARLTVEDDGIGISQEEQQKIFERFYRGDPSRSSSRQTYGAGLGLSMVKKIVEVHGGDIEVRSEPGKGTAFAVDLPAV